ncbi:MAG: hypothetical protein F6J90_05065 [Moorea sp. SIOASIH]|uniref:hypothetical protein n=1 Tax=Moorena sp. SIOASIH TaxID=2607817 RepID=UPI0013B8B1B7|nr:hypothetical protein [Moorena sp. SIOASIH]NEO35724.1 hypothetical protein [Moorena sp. SIOASIH]NEO89971.1 hypothetical protein [Moorena sp. SIO3G5]
MGLKPRPSRTALCYNKDGQRPTQDDGLTKGHASPTDSRQHQRSPVPGGAAKSVDREKRTGQW